jgi:pimeloyl-ACP methyl ester carboxylesterase
MANRPPEGSRATRQALDDPSRENIRHYLSVHINDESLVTDELVGYIHRAHDWSPDFIEARRQSVSVPHDYTQDLAGIQAPVLLIHGPYDWMVALRGQHRDPQPHCRLAPGASQQLRALAAAVREAGRMDRAGPRVARLLSETARSNPISVLVAIRELKEDRVH